MTGKRTVFICSQLGTGYFALAVPVILIVQKQYAEFHHGEINRHCFPPPPPISRHVVTSS